MKKIIFAALGGFLILASACSQVDKGANGSGTADSLAQDSTMRETDMNQQLDTPSGTSVQDTGSVLTDSTIKK